MTYQLLFILSFTFVNITFKTLLFVFYSVLVYTSYSTLMSSYNYSLRSLSMKCSISLSIKFDS